MRILGRRLPTNGRVISGLSVGDLTEHFDIAAADLEKAQGRASLSEQVAAFEKIVIVQALRESQGCAASAIDRLGLPRKTFYDKLKKYDLKRHGFD